MTDADELRVAGSGERWRIEGGRRAADRQLCNDYLSYLADRRYSPASVRAYAFDLLHFARWLAGQDAGLDAVDTIAPSVAELVAASARHLLERQRGTRVAVHSSRRQLPGAARALPPSRQDLLTPSPLRPCWSPMVWLQGRLG